MLSFCQYSTNSTVVNKDDGFYLIDKYKAFYEYVIDDCCGTEMVSIEALCF